MNYTCDKCGATVQEGRAFCPNCSAPQIRVSVPESSPSFEPGTPAGMQPPAQPVSLESRTLSPTEIDWSAAWAAVLVAGVIGGFCFFLPLNFVWIVASGALAVYLYSRRRPPYMQISSGTGAKLGAVSGVVGYLLFAIVAVLGLSFAGDRVWSELTNEMHRQAGANPNANLQQMFEIMKTPEGKAVIAVFVMIFAFAFFLLLSTLGGAIGASLVQRNKRFL